MRVFQVIVLGAFGVLAVVGVLFFAGVLGPLGGGSNIGSVQIWGSLPQEVMDELIGQLSLERKDFDGVKYRFIPENQFEETLLAALASGTGPDLILLSQDAIVRERPRLAYIPYSFMSERTFKDTFIEEGEMFLAEQGILGLPFTVDPLLMYWNRDLFAQEAIARPPQFWDELYTLAPRLTKRDERNNIRQSIAALGEYANVEHAKDILATLMIQAGAPIVAPNTETGALEPAFGGSTQSLTTPAVSALRYYTEFANPTKNIYSWNRGLPNSKKAFTSGTLALYFGYLSEYGDIAQGNPNLNYDISLLPRTRGGGVNATFGRMRALAVTRTTDNPQGAVQVALALTTDTALDSISQKVVLPPPSRALLSRTPTDSVFALAYRSAVITRGWFDPDPTATDRVFRDMIEGVTSGRVGESEAVSQAENELSRLLRGDR